MFSELKLSFKRRGYLLNRVRVQTPKLYFNSIQKSVKRRFRLKPSSNCTEELPPVGCPYYHWGMRDSSCHARSYNYVLKITGGYDKYPWSAASHTQKTVDIMFVTVIHKGTNKKSFIYSAASLTNKFQQNLMNVPNYYKHNTYQNEKK